MKLPHLNIFIQLFKWDKIVSLCFNNNSGKTDFRLPLSAAQLIKWRIKTIYVWKYFKSAHFPHCKTTCHVFAFWRPVCNERGELSEWPDMIGLQIYRYQWKQRTSIVGFGQSDFTVSYTTQPTKNSKRIGTMWASDERRIGVKVNSCVPCVGTATTDVLFKSSQYFVIDSTRPRDVSANHWQPFCCPPLLSSRTLLHV